QNSGLLYLRQLPPESDVGSAARRSELRKNRRLLSAERNSLQITPDFLFVAQRPAARERLRNSISPGSAIPWPAEALAKEATWRSQFPRNLAPELCALHQ